MLDVGTFEIVITDLKMPEIGGLEILAKCKQVQPDAEVIVVNTCGFIESARQESKSVIREMLDLKRKGGTRGVIVAGCLPERLGGSLLHELPEIDHIVGVFGP